MVSSKTPLSSLALLLCVAALGCSSGSSDNSTLVARTAFSNSEVITTQLDDGTVKTELFDADGDAAVTVVQRDGAATLQLGSDEPLPFSVDAWDDATVLHEAVRALWQQSQDRGPLPAGVSAATTCYVGDSPRVQVPCQEPLCELPPPYQDSQWGYGPIGIASYSEAQCHAYRDACGASDAWTLYYYTPSSIAGPHTTCIWYNGTF